MKFTKLSLVAALAVSAAVAGGDIAPVEPAAAPVEAVSPWTVSGDAKLYYSTTDGNKYNLFDKGAGDVLDGYATGQAAISADVSYALNNNWKVNFGMTGLATLGLDDSVVSYVWLRSAASVNGKMTSVGDALWIDTANITGTAFDGKATFILGRTELDTPFVFSEKWNIAPNTFDAAVAMVKPVDALTLVAGYVYDGNGNGARIGTFKNPEGGFTHGDGYFPLFTGAANEISDQAWAVAAIGTVSNVTGQIWYEEVLSVAQALWVQADGNFNGFTAGAQYAYITPDSTLESAVGGPIDNSSAYAFKLGYSKDALNVWAAYSSVDNKGVIPISNTATMVGGAGWGGKPLDAALGSQSKLYTEAWWNYGFVSQPDAQSFAGAIDYKFSNFDVLAQYTNVQHARFASADLSKIYTADMDEFALVGSTKLIGLDVSLAYIYGKFDYKENTNRTHSNNTLQAYVTYKF